MGYFLGWNNPLILTFNPNFQPTYASFEDHQHLHDKSWIGTYTVFWDQDFEGIPQKLPIDLLKMFDMPPN